MKKRIVILGAGISGLALGWSLKQQYGNQIELTILEKSQRPGGWIQTLQHQGFLFEQGPRSCRPGGNGEATLKLIKDLGMEHEIITASPVARKRYLYWNQQLHQLPTNPLRALFSPLLKGILPALYRDWRTAKGMQEEETIYDFISRRLSPEIADRLIDPLTSGIYAGDIRQLSIRSCFPLLHDMEQQHGSLIKAMWKKERVKAGSIFSLQRGMESLITALAQKLEPHLHLNCEATCVEADKREVCITTPHQQYIGDHVFIALPSYAAAKLGVIKHDIPATSVAVVNLGWHRKVLHREGFGYLIPTMEREQILGAVWDSSAFPQQNRDTNETRLTVMIGGTHMNDFHQHDEKSFVNLAISDLSKHLGIETLPDALHVKIAKNAIPQYLVGHQERVRKNETKAKNFSDKITLIGNSYYGVSVNDCINSALTTSNKSSGVFS